MLAPSTVVVARADAFLIHATGATIRVDLSRGGDPLRVAAAAMEGPAALAAQGFVTAAEAARLDGALARNGIGREAGPPGLLPTRVVPLRAVAAVFAASGTAPQGVLAVTATEALWLPPGCAPATGERALRLFVSRMPDRIRLCAYGRLVSGRRGLAIAGDIPDPHRAGEVCAIATLTAEVTTWSWAGGELAETGRMAGGSPSGRLSIAQVTAIDEWRLDDGTVFHFACGAYASAHLATLNPFAPPGPASHCGGGDTDPLLARVKCETEGLERFAAGDVPPGALHLAPASRLPGDWLDPGGITSPTTGPEVFDPARPEWWVTGHRPSGAPIWLPAALVFTPFPDVPGWVHDGHLTSNATAAHPDPEQAVLRAWLEGVEREAFQRARTTGIELASVPEPLRPLIRYVQARADLRLVHLENAYGIPVIAAAVASAVGLCAAADPVAAARQAIVEAFAATRFPFTPETAGWLLDGPAAGWPSWSPAAPPRVPDHVAIYRYPSRFLNGLAVVKVLDPHPRLG
jgi:hypothetical protein